MGTAAVGAVVVNIYCNTINVLQKRAFLEHVMHNILKIQTLITYSAFQFVRHKLLDHSKHIFKEMRHIDIVYSFNSARHGML